MNAYDIERLVKIIAVTIAVIMVTLSVIHAASYDLSIYWSN